MRSLSLLAIPPLMVALVACPGKSDSPPSKRQLESNSYRQCVGTDRSSSAQSRCQVHVWGQTFGEEDERWICDRMGNWQCGSAEVES